MKVSIIGGVAEYTSPNNIRFESFDGNAEFSAAVKNNWTAKKTSIGKYEGSNFEEKRIDKKVLILRGTRRKGVDLGHKPHRDLMFRDYPQNEEGYQKLRDEIYSENFNSKDPKRLHVVANRDAEAWARANKVVRKIRDFCNPKNSNDILFKMFYNDVEDYAKGKLEDVIHTMVNKMRTNTSNKNEFSKIDLTNAVREHPNQVTFTNAVMNVLRQYLSDQNISPEQIDKLAIKDDKQGDLYGILDNQKVQAPRFPDKFSGLGIIVNDIWAYEVWVTKIITKKHSWMPNVVNTEIVLDFVYYDHFGLDYPDLEKKRAPSPWIAWDHNVFYSWFVLQHFRGFKPFITKIENSYILPFTTFKNGN